MQTKIKVINPDSIQMELTITMDLKKWKELRAQLQQAWPSWDLGSAIADMISQAEKHFYPEDHNE